MAQRLLSPEPRIMDPVDIAWVAGVIEGEGCFQLERRQMRPGVQVNMTDRDVIQKLQDVTGMGRVYGPRSNGSKANGEPCKPIWLWHVKSKWEVARLLLAIYPLMGERRRARIGELVPYLPYERG